MKQITDTLFMVRPVHFRMNEQTAVNNYYQKVIENVLPATLLVRAKNEFNDFVQKLEDIGVTVVVVDDKKETDTPDAHFPNNWVSFHENGTVATYPMSVSYTHLTLPTIYSV